jgi:hypothetical protein
MQEKDIQISKMQKQLNQLTDFVSILHDEKIKEGKVKE